MKKAVITAALMVSSVAMAGEFAEFNWTPNKNYSGAQTAWNTSVILGTQATKELSLGIKGSMEREKASSDYTNSLEGQATYDFGGVYVRGGLGQVFANGGNDYNFYAGAVGLKVPVTAQVSAIAEYERTQTFDGSDPSFNTYKLGAAYDVTKKDTIGAAWLVQNGDIVSHGVGFSYGRKF